MARVLLGQGRPQPKLLMPAVVANLCLVIQLLWAAPVFGDPAEPSTEAASADQARLAEALFDQAKQAMERGDFASACAKLEESRRLEPAGGTQLALGLCYEQAGRLASAWYAYREAFAAAQRDARPDRESIAEERLAELEPRLSRVTVVVPPEVASLPELHVELGGLELRRPSWGLAVPYDAGSYLLRARARGYVSWTETVVVGSAADHRRVVVPALDRAPPELQPEAPIKRPSPGVPPERSVRRTATPVSLHQRLGYVFAGAAAAALIPGVYYGGRAIARGETIGDACQGDICARSAERDHQDALADARRADVLIVSGLVALGVSVYFFVTASSSSSARKARVDVQATALGLAF